MEGSGISVTNHELRTTREVARELGSLLSLLESGALEKVVITRQGQMVGVLIAPETFAELTSG